MRLKFYIQQIAVKITLCFTLAMFSIAGFAKDLPFQLPEKLAINGKPIPPKCFLNFVSEENKSNHIDLKNDKCMQYQQTYNAYALKNGFLGYDLKSNEPSMRAPSIFYRYVGKISENNEGLYVFEINWSGGGSGSFSELIALALKNDTILTLQKEIEGGDRCNGGIVEAKIQDNLITFKKQATSLLFTYPTAESSMPANLNLEDCAVCCIGTILMSGDDITGFTFNGILPSVNSDNAQQACFNKLIREAGAKDKGTLNSKQYLSLQENIKQQCLEK